MGCFATSRGSPTLVIPAVSCCQCISAKIEHNSDRCHGEMYFDIVLVYATKHGNKRPPPPTGNQKLNRGDGGGGTSHSARSTRCTVRQASHGSPMLAPLCFFLFFFNNKLTIEKGSMGSVYGYYRSWVSHVGNTRYDHATETEIVVLLLVRYFLGGRIFSMKRQR